MEPQASTYICTVTRMRTRNPLVLPLFLYWSFRAALAAWRTPGNRRTRLLGLPPFPIFLTLSVWDSREALDAFVQSPVHRVCMAHMAAWASRGSFTTFPTETRRVGWVRAMRMLRDPDSVWTPQGRTRRAAA